MPLFVKDEHVNELAIRAQKLLGTASKTEAVRIALERVLQERANAVPLRDRLNDIQRRTLALGTPDPKFDDKALMDELWGEG